MLEQTIRGVHFQNPLGLAAGFDKDAYLTSVMGAVGFGFEEIGSVTGEACEGNPKPRLWRMQKSEGLVVHYGLKSQGSQKVSERLRMKTFSIPVGISIARTNSQDTIETEAGIQDYLKVYQAFSDSGDYYTINISCPNVFGGQPFTDAPRLARLLDAIDALPKKKPIFIKLSPDLSEKEIDGILIVASTHKIDGFVCTNLTKERKGNECILDKNIPNEGGMSGKVVSEKSDRLIRYIYRKSRGVYDIIGCGGVFSADDAYRKIKLGASLIELITGMVYEGPQVISEINRGLVRLLVKDGYRHISEAVGVENRFSH